MRWKLGGCFWWRCSCVKPEKKFCRERNGILVSLSSSPETKMVRITVLDNHSPPESDGSCLLMLECPLAFHRLSSQAASFTRDNYPQHHCVVGVPAWEYRGRIASVPNVDKHNTGVSSSQNQAPSDDLHLCTTMLPNIDFQPLSQTLDSPNTNRLHKHSHQGNTYHCKYKLGWSMKCPRRVQEVETGWWVLGSGVE